MLELFALFCVLACLVLLGILSYIDLKEHLLPNELVLGFACCGFVFHLSTLFHYLSLNEMALGALIGGGMLYLIRGIANYWYDEDTLGLGDVKLLAAGGLWLGPEFILIAAAIGAMMGFLHGLGVALYTVYHAKLPLDMNKLAIPAGPGFAAGLIITGLYAFNDLPWTLFQ